MGKLAHFVFVFFFLLSYSIAFNITEILNDFPEYALYNNFLTRTRLADDINSRNTITVLVLRDSVLSQISSNVPLSEIKNELSVHVLLDFYDSQKLHSSQSFYVTTLYQTTGKADRYNGFVNITVEKDGKVGFRSADPASNQSSYYVKTVKSSPYNISVLEIATPIQAPGLISSPSPSPVGVNITDLLVKSNCKKFASLLVSSGVMKFYESQIRSGLTVFSPTDSCFNISGIPNLKNLSIAEIVSVLKYHALPEYFPIASLKVINEPLRTMASDNPGNFEISVSVSGDSVMLKTGVDNGGILATLIDDTPLCIFTIDHVLLPSELFGSLSPPPPSLLPSPPSSSSPSPSPSSSRKISPSPSPYLTSPPLPSPPSPPSPPSLTSPPSEESPAMSPESDHNHSGSTMTEIPAMMNIILAAFALTSLLSFRL